MEQLWYLFALLSGLASATYTSVNQFFRMSGALLMVYRGLMVAALVLPFMLVHPFIKNPYFYLICLLQGIVIAVLDYRFARAVKVFSAAVTATVQPMSIGIIFFMWLLFTPSLIRSYIAHPVQFLIILICLSGIVLAALKLRHAKTGRRAMKYLMPCLLLLALGDVLNKQAMMFGAENLTAAIFSYCFITGLVCGSWNFILYFRQEKSVKPIFEKKNLLRGLVISLSMIFLMASKNAAMSGTPNPAYVTAIISLYPLWILLGQGIYQRLNPRAKKISVQPWIVCLLVLCVVVLILNSTTK